LKASDMITDQADLSQGGVAFAKLMHAIESGVYQPGDRLRETEIADRLALSRTPIREALRRLEAEKIIEHRPRVGAVIRTLGQAEVVELYEMRLVLERTAAEMAAKHAAAAEVDAMAGLNDEIGSILGVAVGATFTVSLIISMADMWATLILVPVMVFLIGLVGVPYFQRLWGFDFATSYYSAMPGGLQDMLLFGEEAGGDVRALSLIHATRVMVIVVALPFILQGYWGVDLSNPPGAPAATLPVSQMALMLGFCLILLVLAAIFVEIIHLFSLAPPMEALLAFAPGGQAEMTVLALIAGADMAFVIAHHVLRIVTVIVGAPIAAKFFNR